MATIHRWTFSIILIFLFVGHVSILRAAETVELRGLGASFPETVYKDWRLAYRSYRSSFVNLDMPYLAKGSGKGKTAILKGPSVEVEYAGSDSLLSDTDRQGNPHLKMFPTMAGALVLAYNIPEVQGTLRLTREQVLGIYNGTFTNWNDPTFLTSNPGTTFPNATIQVVARADKSGSTDMFTGALSMFSEQWKSRAGRGRFSEGLNESSDQPLYWDPNVVKYFGRKTRGMSGLIMSIKYAIGYLSVADAAAIGDLEYAILQNKAGNYIKATTNAVQSSMEFYSTTTNSLTPMISDSPQNDSYPIAGYTYFIVHMDGMLHCDRAIELVRYVEFFMNNDQPRAACTALKMVPLSSSVVERVTSEVLEKMTCGSEKLNVWRLREDQIYWEDWNSQTWRTPVAVTTTLFLVAMLVIFSYFLYRRIKLRKMIDSNEWDIPIEDIIFYFDEKTMSNSKSKLFGFRSVKSFKSLDDISEGGELLNNILQWPGKWKANQVGLRLLEVKSLSAIQRNTKRHMLWMRDSVIHTNVVRFFGLTELDSDRYVISEYCGKGPMTDILQDEKYNFTSDFKFSLSNDIASGLFYLHAQGITHGNLRSSCCLIDNRWNVKVADWEYCKLLSSQNTQKSPLLLLRSCVRDSTKHVAAFREFWTAPELLQSDFDKLPTPSSDVYSFAIILQEIFTREDPYAEHADLLSPEEVLRSILNNGLRPKYSNDTPVAVRQIMEIGWSDEPFQRPSFEQILKMLRHANPSRKSMVDTMMEAMEEYTCHLEDRIEERTSELLVAKHNMESLLSGLIPAHIASKLANGQTGQAGQAEVYESMAVLSVEVLDFPDLSILPSPLEAVAYLNQVNGEIESVIKKYEIFRASMEGDIYTLVSGFAHKEASEDSASAQVAHLVLDMAEIVNKLPQPSFHTRPIRLRYGAHVGRVIGVLVGENSPRFCFLGSAVKTAVLLKDYSLPSKIHISTALQQVIAKKGFHTEERTGKPIMALSKHDKTYWLTGRDCVHLDMSSELSSDSGIDGFTNDKSNSYKPANTICEPMVKLVTTDAKQSCDHDNARQKADFFQGEKWHEIFCAPKNQEHLDRKGVVKDAMEMTDISKYSDGLKPCDTESLSVNNAEPKLPPIFVPVSTPRRQSIKSKIEDIVVEPLSRGNSPVQSGVEQNPMDKSKSSKSKINKVAPLIYV